MSTLWTPGGEHEVPRDEPAQPDPTEAAGPPDGAPTSLADIPGFDELSVEDKANAEAMAREMTEARQRIAEVPAAEVVANHVMGLYELASIHLSEADLEQTRVAVDAMTAIIAALPGRLGENEAVLRDALQQLQLAVVQASQLESDQADD